MSSSIPGFASVLMQRVQAFTWRSVPLSKTRVFWMFGLNGRLVRRFEKLTLRPNVTVLPQISHVPAMTFSLLPVRLSSSSNRRPERGREVTSATTRNDTGVYAKGVISRMEHSPEERPA